MAWVAAALGVVAVWAGAPVHTVLLVGVLLVRPATMLVMTRSMSGQQRRGGRDPAASWQRPAEPGHPDGPRPWSGRSARVAALAGSALLACYLIVVGAEAARSIWETRSAPTGA